VTLFLVALKINSARRGLHKYDVDYPEKDIKGVYTVLMRTLTSFLQATHILSSIHTDWPDLTSKFSAATEVAESATSDFLSIDCLFGELRGDEPKYLFRSVILNLVPFILIVVVIILGLLMHFKKKKEKR